MYIWIKAVFAFCFLSQFSGCLYAQGEKVEVEFMDCIWSIKKSYYSIENWKVIQGENDLGLTQSIFFTEKLFSPSFSQDESFTNVFEYNFDNLIGYKMDFFNGSKSKKIFLISSKASEAYATIFGYSEDEIKEIIHNCNVDFYMVGKKVK